MEPVKIRRSTNNKMANKNRRRLLYTCITLVMTLVASVYLYLRLYIGRSYRVHRNLISTTYLESNYSFGLQGTYQNISASPFIDIRKERTSFSVSGIKNKTLTILWINKPVWVKIEYLNSYLADKCPFKNCKMAINKQGVEKMAAIIFSTQGNMPTGSQLLRNKRPKEQVWVFFRREPPAIYHMKWYQEPEWRNTMNWSWGYRFDSDIFFPYQTLSVRNKPLSNRNYSEIYRNKSRDAAWAVSRCPTQSKRDEYVKRLQQLGVSIDVFGKCSKQKKKLPWDQLNSIIGQNYKFYLSFESSFCKDYVTEKFFHYFGLDIVPLVRGYLNYSRYLDASTFINTADFASVEKVAEYIKMVGRNEHLYTKFLKAKEKYVPTTTNEEFAISSCDLCKKLNNVEKYRKVYDDIDSYIHSNTCFPPKDIH